MPYRSLLALAGILLGACATSPLPTEALLSQALRSAEAHYDYDLEPEAAVLLEAIAAVDPEYPGVQDLGDRLNPRAFETTRRSPLGMNRPLRPEIERSVAARVLWYLPDRMLDLLDIATFDVHLGMGGFIDVHFTRAVQLVGGVRTTGGVGLHEQRSLGLKSQAEAGLAVLMAGAHSYGGGLIGTSGAKGASSSTVGLHRPGDPVYQQLRDYWAIGASATAGLVGLEAELHPLQIVDFLAGWFAIDLLRDDFAHTRALKLRAVDRELIAELWRTKGSRSRMLAYQDAKTARTLADAPAEAPAQGELLPFPAAPRF